MRTADRRQASLAREQAATRSVLAGKARTSATVAAPAPERDRAEPPALRRRQPGRRNARGPFKARRSCGRTKIGSRFAVIAIKQAPKTGKIYRRDQQARTSRPADGRVAGVTTPAGLRPGRGSIDLYRYHRTCFIENELEADIDPEHRAVAIRLQDRTPESAPWNP
jgi:hypothetical protein